MAKDYFCQLIPNAKERDQFIEWAFGDEFDEHMLLSRIPVLWNTLHGKKYKIESSGNVWEDLSEMVDIWHEETKK